MAAFAGLFAEDAQRVNVIGPWWKGDLICKPRTS
jgi:hypothetical protein